MIARTQNSGDGFSPRARELGCTDRRETSGSPCSTQSARAYVLRAFAQREGNPKREREREKERASPRATLVKSVGNINTKTTVVVLGVRKKKGEKAKKVDGGRGDFITYDAKRKRAALLSMAIKISPFFFCLLQRRARLWKKKGGFVVGVGKNWLGNFR